MCFAYNTIFLHSQVENLDERKPSVKSLSHKFQLCQVDCNTL